MCLFKQDLSYTCPLSLLMFEFFVDRYLVEIIFVDQGFRKHQCIRYCKISRSLIFEARCESAKNVKIVRLENLASHDSSFR